MSVDGKRHIMLNHSKPTNIGFLGTGVLATLMVCATPALHRPCMAQSQPPPSPTRAGRDASNDLLGLTVRAKYAVPVKGADLVVLLEQPLEGDANTMDAALADAKSRLVKIADEAKLAGDAVFLQELRTVEGSRGGGSISKSGGPGRATWCIRVPDRAAIESVLVASATLPNDIRVRAVTPVYRSIDPIAHGPALAGASELARKRAAAAAEASGCRLGVLISMRETESSWNNASSFDSTSMVVHGARVWMPEIVTPQWVVSVEATFEILPP